MNEQPTSSATWRSQHERGSLLGMRILLVIYRLFGSRVCKAVLMPILLYFYWTNNNVKTALSDYYQKLLSINPDIAVKPFANVRYFGFGIIDRLALWHGRLAVSDKITAHNAEVLYDYAEKSSRGGRLFPRIWVILICVEPPDASVLMPKSMLLSILPMPKKSIKF